MSKPTKTGRKDPGGKPAGAAPPGREARDARPTPSAAVPYGQGAGLSYGEYLHVPQILREQHCLSDPPVHDELQFIIVHQVYELWFKLILHELDAVKAALGEAGAAAAGAGAGVNAAAEDDTAEREHRALRTATRLSRRVEAILKVLVQQIHVLETMRPVDFLAFRANLNPASGFQSAQFRQVECLLGLKDEALARRLAADGQRAAVEERLQGDTIPDALYRLLAAHGLNVTPADEGRSEAQRDATLDALREIYEHPDEHAALHDLCEALMDVDEQIVLWRRHHVMMVERQIGAKPGTGKGTTGDLDGIRYLQTTLAKHALPDLWAVRTVLRG
jgi:tryptophan 2,3-dioxygenase